MKGGLAIAMVVALAILTTLAVFQALHWLAALRQRRRDLLPTRDAELVRLLDEKNRLLQHLREIQFDHETGKLDATDYGQLRDRYEREAVAVLAELDRRRAVLHAAPHGPDTPEPRSP